jgi:hypothetical protein
MAPATVVALAAASFLVYSLVFPQTTIHASTAHVSISLTENEKPQLADLTPSTLDIRFEPSGTHVDSKGNLKIRLDFFPTPDSKSYASQHVEVVDEKSEEYQRGYPGELDKDGQPLDPKAYDEWLAKLPKVWQTNPCLSHFITVKPDITQADLDAIVKSLFPGTATATIDDASIQSNSAHLLSPYMRDKSKATSVKMWDDDAAMTPILADLSSKGTIEAAKATLASAKADPATKLKVEDSIVTDLNLRLAGYGLAADSKDAPIEPITPQSIDVGSSAINRTYHGNLNTFTVIDLNNPANATGTLDTFQYYAPFTSHGVVMGTFSGSGSTWTSRDYETIGTISAGSTQTFTGKSCDVSTDDCIGWYETDENFEYDTSGAGWKQKIGNWFGAGAQTYGNVASRTTSLYATGTEAASFAITNAPGTTIALGTLAVSSSYYFYGSAPSNPVGDAECTQTLTETGGSACDIDIHGHNSTGGGGMTLTASAPGANQFRITVYKGGDNPASGLVITTSDQEFKDNLAASGHFHWDGKFESGSSFTETAAQTTTLTVTARTHS